MMVDSTIPRTEGELPPAAIVLPGTAPKELVVPTEDSDFDFSEIMPNATAWVWSDKKPDQEIIPVTAHGLRRLLRFAKAAQAIVQQEFFVGTTLAGRRATREELKELYQESSTIWIEDDLVMSRLFLLKDGSALVAHSHKEVDDASIPPWERTDH